MRLTYKNTLFLSQACVGTEFLTILKIQHFINLHLNHCCIKAQKIKFVLRNGWSDLLHTLGNIRD